MDMDKNEIIRYVKEHPSGKVKIAFADIDGILRGKYISTEKFLSVCDGTTGFCDVVFGWDAADVAFLTSFGPVEMLAQSVEVRDVVV